MRSFAETSLCRPLLSPAGVCMKARLARNPFRWRHQRDEVLSWCRVSILFYFVADDATPICLQYTRHEVRLLYFYNYFLPCKNSWRKSFFWYLLIARRELYDVVFSAWYQFLLFSASSDEGFHARESRTCWRRVVHEAGTGASWCPWNQLGTHSRSDGWRSARERTALNLTHCWGRKTGDLHARSR